MEINGIHHATMVSSNAQRTVDFYSGLLGMRLIKQTVNFDQPDTRHLYFSDAQLTRGSVLTFFVWPNTRRGNEGIGGTHHIALSTENEEAQLRWKRWLMDNGIRVWGPYNRVYFSSIYFNDPDGLILEIATRGPGFTVDEPADQLGSSVKFPPFETMAGGRDEEAIELSTWSEPVTAIDAEMELTPIHHISAIGTNDARTRGFFNDVLGMRTVKRTVNFDNPKSPHLYLSAGDGDPGTIITYFAYEFGEMRPFRMGTGVTHHFALAVESAEDLGEWKSRLAKENVESSEIRDRKYFKSIYLHDPDGQIIELATAGPGFLIDEDERDLGRRLQLPEHLEPRRDEIESSLEPLIIP
jgi:glyoxalase family protein